MVTSLKSCWLKAIACEFSRDVRKAEWLARQGAELHAGDVTDAASLQSAATGVDVVFHLAAFVSEWGPWDKFEAIIVAGTKNALAAAVTAGVRRFVHVSTATVYDDAFARRARVITEDAPLGTAGDRAYGNYSKAKVLAEQAVWQMHRQGQLEITVLAPPGFMARAISRFCHDWSST